MAPNWIGIAAGTLSVVIFFSTYRAGRPLPTGRRTLFTLLALILAIPGASFAAYYTHLFPEPAWYYEFRSWAGTEFLILSIGLAGGLLCLGFSSLGRICVLLMVVALSFGPFLKPILGALNPNELRDLWYDDVCMQSTASTCGAASVATILRHFNLNATEAVLAREAYSYVGGTEAWYLARTARRRGLNATFQFISTRHPTTDLVLPALAGVRLAGAGHFIPILSFDGEAYVIGDPLVGRQSLSRPELLNRYDFTGFFMPIQVPSSH